MKRSKIEWTEATWNPSVGCNKISQGCKFCYAEVMAHRLQSMGIEEYKDGFKFKVIESRITAPLAIKKPTLFFVNSMSDLFHEEMPFDFLDKVFKVIQQTPHHTYQILTKRSDIMLEYCKDRVIPKNAWLGVTVESSQTKFRIEDLVKVNCKVRFLSIEPLLEDVGKLNLEGIHWVIVGGESGAKARPMKAEWAENIKTQCKDQEVPFFFKQWGAWGSDGIKRSKKRNGRLLGGREWNETPFMKKSKSVK